MKRAICNPDKCHKCQHLGRKFVAWKGWSAGFEIDAKRYCYRFNEFLLEKFGGETVGCEQCKVPEYITKTWYKDCR